MGEMQQPTTSQSQVRILVDGTSAHAGGGATYLMRQLEALARRSDLQLTVYARSWVAKALVEQGLPVEVRRRPRLPLFARLLWEQAVLPWKARSFDVVYMPGNFALFASPRPQVVVFHNLYHFGRQGARARRFCGRGLTLRLAVESRAAHLSVRRATLPVTLSRSMRRAIEEDLGRVEHLRVIYPGTTPPFRSAKALEARPEGTRRERPRTASSYALAVSNDYPHKDWEGLIGAFEQRSNLPPLKIVGRARTPKRHAELQSQIRRKGLEDRVQLLGTVEDAAELGMLYANAVCFIAHSYLETFPQTPYEAMFYGLPVVASDIPSHRELCGDCAVFYPPERPDLLAAAVIHALNERSLPRARPPLASRTWSDHAEEFASALTSAARAPQPAGQLR